ncbi:MULTISPECIES: PTS sugar transporter subunit IIB [Clostridium]|jgi:PTS system cellobiose-specific IIB component|uniref:PTS sugar transporter subunit IIB n=1 Tax=Clostridium paridis TaxID=2803863 RepID=A0A937K586_9CLOT|nr:MULTISPECIES: PTS sugar transporter subunit IIB [Clostridium]MBL4932729.1 PTS sugar transporter subunit IIB [Clostridium paridis]MDD7792646.1 PTS sugar transporter subunit IIB [Clostridium sp. 'White wine YQ']
MKRILLICSAGMSTSLLVSKMQAAAKEQGIEVWINAVAESELRNYEDQIDILLLGPQVRFLLNKLKAKMEPKGVPVDVINTIDYGTMNGAKVLKFALDKLS